MDLGLPIGVTKALRLWAHGNFSKFWRWFTYFVGAIGTLTSPPQNPSPNSSPASSPPHHHQPAPFFASPAKTNVNENDLDQSDTEMRKYEHNLWNMWISVWDFFGILVNANLPVKRPRRKGFRLSGIANISKASDDESEQETISLRKLNEQYLKYIYVDNQKKLLGQGSYSFVYECTYKDRRYVFECYYFFFFASLAKIFFFLRC